MALQSLSRSPWTSDTMMGFVPTLSARETHDEARTHSICHACETSASYFSSSAISSDRSTDFPKALAYSPLTPYLMCRMVRLLKPSKKMVGVSMKETSMSTIDMNCDAWIFLGRRNSTVMCGAIRASSLNHISPSSSGVRSVLQSSHVDRIFCAWFCSHTDSVLAMPLDVTSHHHFHASASSSVIKDPRNLDMAWKSASPIVLRWCVRMPH
mmetsp:Transcript_23187/g.58097  ORF Transcript_23187/g.58097 Transcript_23187/m.58097 type:complete len:211 (-) Transcript_23187:1954-2586(-)